MVRGVVIDDKDPEKRGRVRVASEMFYDAATNSIIPSPWCETRSAAMGGTGTLVVPPMGSEVWLHPIEDVVGGIERIFYSPGSYHANAPAPLTGRGEEDWSTGTMRVSAKTLLPAAQNQVGLKGRTTTVHELVEARGIPESANAGEYPYVQMFKSVAGIVVEFDDTPGANRVAVWHPSGATIEINHAGVLVVRGTRLWTESIDSDTRSVGGDLQASVAGNEQKYVGVNQVTEVGGRCCTMAGEVNIAARSFCVIDAGNAIQLSTNGTINLRSGAGISETVIGDKGTTAAGSISQTATGNVNRVAMQRTVQSSALSHTVVTPMLDVQALSVLLGPLAAAAGDSAILATAFTAAFTVWAAAVASAVGSIAGGQAAGAAIVTANTAFLEGLQLARSKSVRMV